MKPPEPSFNSDSDYDREGCDSSSAKLRDIAASWVVRRDRGLSPAEEVEFKRWLEADPRHAAALARSAQAWSMLAGGAGTAIHVAPAPAHRVMRWRPLAWGGLAAAAGVALLLTNAWREPKQTVPSRDARVATVVATPQTRVLSDGTVVRLNVGAEVAEEFTAAVRDVRLVRGEAYFAVTPDAERPFVVRANAVAVRAVGTAFNVRMQASAVDVLVTEGTVQVASADAARTATPPPLVTAGHRAVVPLAVIGPAAQIVISSATADQIARELAWREPLLKLGGATLAELAVQFEQKTGRRLVLADPVLAQMRIGGRFPSEDVDGFVRVLEQHYGVICVREADGTLRLSQRP
jgi:transmembrane sensor